MQIILLEKIANVGNLGDVVKVKDGFARNFLIPQGQGEARDAREPEAARREARGAREGRSATSSRRRRRSARSSKARRCKILQKAGVDGRLFGSVSNVDIVEALAAQGIAIEKAQVRMPAGPLKHVGDHPVTIALHTDVVAHITVNVQAETVVQV